jgi:hypothetical protein
MREPSYQTVRLTKGKHTSPHHGVCVMELTSMLAGEPFTDQPSSASRSIGAFLRMYNDMLDDRRRQDLYSYASQVVGTVGSKWVERTRVERLIGWAEEMLDRRSGNTMLRRVTRRAACKQRKDPECAARYAIKAMGKVNDEVHARALALVDELIDIGAPSHPDLASVQIAAPRGGTRVHETSTSGQ